MKNMNHDKNNEIIFLLSDEFLLYDEVMLHQKGVKDIQKFIFLSKNNCSKTLTLHQKELH